MNETTPQTRPQVEDLGPSIQLVSGPLFSFWGHSLESIRIEDIAHALSNICRFTGHTREFYSVAQHSVLVALQVPREHQLAALLHDAPEAYINDMSRPVKYMEGMEGYKRLEQRIWCSVAWKFGLPLELDRSIKIADNRMLFTEKRDLLPPCDWEYEEEPYPAEIIPWSPTLARDQFLDLFGMITKTPPTNAARI